MAAEDLRVLSNLIVTLMVGATEAIVNARPDADAVVVGASAHAGHRLVGSLAVRLVPGWLMAANRGALTSPAPQVPGCVLMNQAGTGREDQEPPASVPESW